MITIVDQFQAQQRGEHPERADVQGLLVHRAERGGVHRHTGRAKVVVPNRLHAHHREQAGDGGQFCSGANPDGAMPLVVQALDFAVLQAGRLHQFCFNFKSIML